MKKYTKEWFAGMAFKSMMFLIAATVLLLFINVMGIVWEWPYTADVLSIAASMIGLAGVFLVAMGVLLIID